ncbi:aquaporin [Dehalococcoidia bacterium]|nr:aquaporin [Dehalococcoidia bacterium]MCL0073348.1 aquaporin [Dehalococcoidia bacterium]MCL0076104.1 aquaporin [Dehalococcoidia bacterium]
MKKYIAEFIGTFALVFCGTGAIIVNEVTGGTITHLGVSIVFGLVVMAMIYTLGDISGAHINPAVTFGFWAAGRFPTRELLPFLTAQFAGAILASIILRFLFPHSLCLGATLPVVPGMQAFAVEVILTFFLMFVIINVSTGAKEEGITAAIAIGSVIALAAMFAGPITGASMNPARSFAPALISNNFASLQVYLLAPLVGAFLGILGCKGVRDKGCCGRPDLLSNKVKWSR